MTPMMMNPPDHWVDLDQPTSIRRPLLLEMMSAYDAALEAPEGSERRAAWTGVGLGYAIAFGFCTREALDRARRTPYALTVHPDEYKPRTFTDEDTAWASGVLWGYRQGTSEGFDVTDCTHCGQRLVHDLDWMSRCEHGDFCEDHITDWHAGTTPVGLACTYEDERGAA